MTLAGFFSKAQGTLLISGIRSCKPRSSHPRNSLALRALSDNPSESEAPSQDSDGRASVSSEPGRVISTPPPGPRSFPKGPPVPKGMKLERIERLGEDSWAGVAGVDRGNSGALPTPLKTALLAMGDVGALMLFASIGRVSHGETLSLMAVTETAFPFLAGWFLTAPFLGGYGEEARGGEVGPAAMTAAKCWAAALPVGLIVRSAVRGYVPDRAFIIVSLAATAVLVGGWRVALAAVTPQAEGAVKQRTNKRGNPFELISLLFSLVKRW